MTQRAWVKRLLGLAMGQEVAIYKTEVESGPSRNWVL